MINTIMFDLDGTLLDMNLELFAKIYFDEMGNVFEGLIGKKKLTDAIWTSTGIMINNIANKSNKEVFMEKFKEIVGVNVQPFLDRFDNFYENEYLNTKKAFNKK